MLIPMQIDNVFCYEKNQYFTVGKWYKIFIYNVGDFQMIRNDEGFNHAYYNVRQWFLTKELLREQKLKRILNNI